MARDYDDLGMRFELPRSKPKPKGREGPQDADGLDLEGWLISATGGRCDWITSVALDGSTPQTRCCEEASRGPIGKWGGGVLLGAKVCAYHKALLQGIVARTSRWMSHWPNARCAGANCAGGAHTPVVYEIRHSDNVGQPTTLRGVTQTTTWCRECYTSIVCGGLALGE